MFKLILLFCLTSVVATIPISDQRQAEYTAKLRSFEVTVPVLVTANGAFISHDVSHRHQTLQNRRHKRHINEDLHYSIKFNNKFHTIQLEPNRNLLAPHAVVERRNGNKLEHSPNRIANITTQISNLGDQHSCHYIGKVHNHTQSYAAISACDGLTGLIRTHDGDFIIEPVKLKSRENGRPHHHLVYKASDVHSQKEKEGLHSSCGVEGIYEDVLKQRDQWQKIEDFLSAKEVPMRISRRRRSVSLERNVEVLVVADKKMIDYYNNEDLNTYILTVMNMVSSIYHDASIGNAINIVVVRIMLLETPEYENELNINHSADETLLSFCQWQQKMNPSDDEHPHHHDVAVLLTRYNICSKSNSRCSTLGLAEIAGMCQAYRSCNVNEDTGLQIAYTIAHEIGHNFGMKHDTFNNGCGTKHGFSQHVMSAQLASDSVSITWSNCSRKEITQFLDRSWGQCLEDEPSELEYTFPELPPGAMYDAHHQCRLAFGPKAKRCNGIESICEALWCQVNNKCVTRLEPAAEGTNCGKHKWCYHGECVTIGEKPASIHGNWGQWSEWSSCSRECGAGVERADRHCDNPAPSNGGSYCTGERRRYRICNTHDCPQNEESFRAKQCSAFDKELYKDRKHTWKPVTLEDNPCQLHCKPDNEFYSVELKNTVIDGTPCKPGTKNMCIHGICKRVACDWIIDGSAQEDRCGLCHGDGTQCITTRGLFKQPHGTSYVNITTLPVGARNVRIEEKESASNYLAIKNPHTKQYYLNGNWIIQWSGEYTADGVMIYYKRDKEKESLLLPGPLKQSLELMLLFQVENPGVSWEYTLPQENATYNPVFHWKFSEWSVCTQTCGGGIQTSSPQCTENEAGLVEDKYCLSEEKPLSEKRECNVHSCPAWWWSGPWQPCSLTCGKKNAGIRKRTVICVRSYGQSEQVALLDSDCSLSEKPDEEESCPDLQECTSDTFWEVGPWMQTCGDDPCEFEQREVKCMDPSGICIAESRPPSLRQCGNISCGYWETTDWSECSVSCGEGIQIRNVSCLHGITCALKDEPRSARECSKHCQEKPIEELTSGTRNMSSMPELLNISKSHHPVENNDNNTSLIKNEVNDLPDGSFVTSEDSDSKAILPEHDINENLIIPSLNLKTTQPENKLLQDEETFNEIIEGNKSNETQKNNLQHVFSNITDIPKQNHSETANTTKTLDLSSSTIPEDHYYMSTGMHEKNYLLPDDYYEDDFYDYSVDDNVIGSSKTTTTSRPDEIAEDKLELENFQIIEIVKEKVKSKKHHKSDERTKKVKIHSGVDAMEVLEEFMKEASSNATNGTLPEVHNAILKYEWVSSDWSECSKPCGNGSQTRKVQCYEVSSSAESLVDDQMCSQDVPIRQKFCNEGECLNWVTGDWSDCSVTCGEGIQSRNVSCPEEGRCDPTTIPKLSGTCTKKSCIDWVKGPWSMCTKTCGGGYQIRFVKCIDSRTQDVSQDCEGERPPHKIHCNKNKCPQLQNQLKRCKDHLDTKLCRRLVHMCSTKFFMLKCCMTCRRKG